jgi:hypothetical protein
LRPLPRPVSCSSWQALAFRLRIRDSAGFLLGDAALLALAAATAVLRITG